MEKPVSFYSEGKRIFANLSLPREGAPGVLFSHGLEGSKDGTKWLILASRLSDSGYASLRFSYRGCGEVPERSEGDPRDSTLTERIKDYRAAIAYLQGTRANPERLGVIGSSFGGMTALAAHDPRVKVIVCLATPSRMPEMLGGVAAAQKDSEWVEFRGGRLQRSIYEDTARYNICEAVKDIRCPLLIIHGGADEVVPVDNAHEIYRSASEPKRLVVVEGGNHSFTEPDHLERVVVLVLEWLDRYL